MHVLQGTIRRYMSGHTPDLTGRHAARTSNQWSHTCCPSHCAAHYAGITKERHQLHSADKGSSGQGRCRQSSTQGPATKGLESILCQSTQLNAFVGLLTRWGALSTKSANVGSERKALQQACWTSLLFSCRTQVQWSAHRALIPWLLSCLTAHNSLVGQTPLQASRAHIASGMSWLQSLWTAQHGGASKRSLLPRVSTQMWCADIAKQNFSPHWPACLRCPPLDWEERPGHGAPPQSGCLHAARP